MPCLLLILFLAFPRIALVLLFLFSNYLQRAYHGLILPLVGFLEDVRVLVDCSDSRRWAL